MMDQGESGFVHSVKVPKFYKIAGGIVRNHVSGKGNLKNLIYNAKHPRKSALLSIVTECVAKKKEIDDLLHRSNFFEVEPRFDPYLAQIFITELIWGKGPPRGMSRPETIFLKQCKNLKKLSREMNCSEKNKNYKPRWARINTLQMSVEEAIKHFTEVDGLTFVEIYTDIEYKDFIQRVKDLEPHEFMADLHVDNLLIFHSNTDFHTHKLYIEGSVILQDKASTLPVQALNIPEGSVVLDACAAPGNKTTQIASAVGHSGGVYAIERDVERAALLKKTLQNAGIGDSLVQVKTMDFTSLKPEDFPDVEYIVMDPSCSNTGIIKDHKINEGRIAKLASFQFTMLEHAMQFPNLKKLSYSTCSIHEIENEEVVEAVLRNHLDFKVAHCIKNWKTRGLKSYPHGEKFIRAEFDSDLCSGFFVAVFKRIKDKDKNM